MSRRAVEIPVFRSPSGDVVEARVAFELVDQNLIPVLGLDADGEAVIDSAVVVSTDEAQSLDLTPTDAVDPQAQYRITVTSPERKRNRALVFLATIPLGAGELPWSEVVASGGGTWIPPGGSGGDGRRLEMQVSGDLLQQRYVGDVVWSTLYDLSTLAGTDGRSPQFAVVDGYIVYRLAGDSAWTELHPIASLVGPQGPVTEWRKTATHIQVRPAGGTTWADLIALDDIRGADGTSIRIVGGFTDPEDLEEFTPDPGDGYLSQVDGHLWAWDGSTWIDLGEIRGPAGLTPEFAIIDGVFVWRYIGAPLWTALYALEDVTIQPADLIFGALLDDGEDMILGAIDA